MATRRNRRRQIMQQERSWLRTELLQLLSAAATLSGLCITGLSLLKHQGVKMGTILADDALAMSSLLFLLCTGLIFFALRYRSPQILRWLKAADILFLLALSSMVLAGFLLVYTVL